MSMTNKNPAFACPQSSVTFCAAVIGAGAAAPTVPANGDFRPATATYPLRANRVSTATADIPTRSSTGVYVVTIADVLCNILDASPGVYSAGNSPTAHMDAIVTKIDAPNRQLTVETRVNGTLTDLGTSDMLVIKCFAQDSNA